MQLNLASEKCFVLKIGKHQDTSTHNFYLDGQQLSTEIVAKDLGINATQNLKWEYHINYLFKIGSQISFQIKKSFKTKNIWTLLKLYLTYIRPKMEYNSPVWSPYLKKDIIKLEAIQRSFTKFACLRCSILFSSYQDRLYKLNLKTLEYRRAVFDLIFLFKIIRGETNLLFSDFFREKNLPFTLRGSKFKIASTVNFKTSQWQGCFFSKVVSIWNNLPDEITSAPNLDSFKFKLNNFDLNAITHFTVESRT